MYVYVYNNISKLLAKQITHNTNLYREYRYVYSVRIQVPLPGQIYLV